MGSDGICLVSINCGDFRLLPEVGGAALRAVAGSSAGLPPLKFHTVALRSWLGPLTLLSKSPLSSVSGACPWLGCPSMLAAGPLDRKLHPLCPLTSSFSHGVSRCAPSWMCPAPWLFPQDQVLTQKTSPPSAPETKTSTTTSWAGFSRLFCSQTSFLSLTTCRAPVFLVLPPDIFLLVIQQWVTRLQGYRGIVPHHTTIKVISG